MVERAKLLFICVEDSPSPTGGRAGMRSPMYTRSNLSSALQFMGCKARHAYKISNRAFELLGTELAVKMESMKKKHSEFGLASSNSNDFSQVSDSSDSISVSEKSCKTTGRKLRKINFNSNPVDLASKSDEFPCVENVSKNFMDVELTDFDNQGLRAVARISRDKFLSVVCRALTEYKYIGPNQLSDLILALKVKERRMSVIVLLCGTSGCGKSTLSSLLASRLGITTAVSTDSIRHMMRSFVDEKQNPLLFASTYQAGEHLDPDTIASIQHKKRMSKEKFTQPKNLFPLQSSRDSQCRESVPAETKNELPELSPKEITIQGFKAQSEMVMDSLERLITLWEKKRESVIVEGVHLSLNFVMSIMKKHHNIIPFLIYISNEEKHMERFAVRSKYMTLDPEKNKYVKYIRNIRTIQDYLCKRADKHLVPKVNNTNIDKSVAAIHATVFACLRHLNQDESLHDSSTNTVPLINKEYQNQYAASNLSSKGMFELIQRQGSLRNLLSLVHRSEGEKQTEWIVPPENTGGLQVFPLNDPTPCASLPTLSPGPRSELFGEIDTSILVSQKEINGVNHCLDQISPRLTFPTNELTHLKPNVEFRGRMDSMANKSETEGTSRNSDALPGSWNHTSPVHVRFGGHGLNSWGKNSSSFEESTSINPIQSSNLSPGVSQNVVSGYLSQSGNESSGIDDLVGTTLGGSTFGKHKLDWTPSEKEYTNAVTVFESEEEYESGYEEGGETESDSENLARDHLSFEGNEDGSVDENLSLEDTAMGTEDEKEEEEKEWFHIPSTDEYFEDLTENKMRDENGCAHPEERLNETNSHRDFVEPGSKSSLDHCALWLQMRFKSISSSKTISSFGDYSKYHSSKTTKPPFSFKYSGASFPYPENLNDLQIRSNSEFAVPQIRPDYAHSSTLEKRFTKSKSDMSWDRKGAPLDMEAKINWG